MAILEESKFITVGGASTLYNDLRDRIKANADTVEGINSSLEGKADIENGKLVLDQLSLATANDIQDIISTANETYTDSAINLALDELNGEVV